MKISSTQYAKTFFELIDGKSEQEVLDVVKKFADILKRDRQLKNFNKIAEKFSEIYNKKNLIAEAVVVSREVLDVNTQEKIKEYVSGKYHLKEVILRNEINSNIMGGIIIKVGDEILDESVLGKIEKMRNELLK
ncbi:MAG: F-type H+-transporting ATPase subunit delta [Parcubacteria group bacterium Athens0714_25]|nr:MAG: F-type H+-transporting ATPase subunit delta [Parcubacteria group bacterium Athens0714_25]